MAANAPGGYRLFTGPFFTLAEHNRAMLERTLRMTQQQSLRLINRRLTRSARAFEGLCDCNGLVEMMAVERDFITGTISDSIEQVQQLTASCWQLAKDGMQPFSDVVPKTPARGDVAGPDQRPNAEHNWTPAAS